MNDIGSNPDAVVLTAGKWPTAQEPAVDESNAEQRVEPLPEFAEWSMPQRAGQLAAEGLSESEQAGRYLNRVAWPLVEGGFHISVHFPSKWIDRKTGEPREGVPGFVFTDLNAALDETLALARNNNVYLAMGGEIKTGTVRGSKTYAKRNHDNVGACHCLYMDLDVKPVAEDPKNEAYRSKDDLWAAFKQFLAGSRLPFPNIIINSGRGGKHLYWLFDRLLTLAEWEPYAQSLVNAATSTGLKFDAQCTVNICCLLRLPGTSNFKVTPPLPVTLIYDDGGVYPIEDLRQALQPYWTLKGGLKHRGKQSRASAAEDDGYDPTVNDDLSAGIDHGWFEKLGDDDKDAALRQMFDVIPDVAHGGRSEWLDCLMAAKASGAPHAGEIAREWSMLSEVKYSDAEFDEAWGSFIDRPGGITVGTLIWLASGRGFDPASGRVFDANAWRAYADGAQSATHQARRGRS
jgi:hypothetical protein